MNTDTTNPTSLLDVEYPISATEVKPLGRFTEEDCYRARVTLTYTQPELVEPFRLLEVELGQLAGFDTAIVADLSPNLVRNTIGHAPTPRPLVGATR